MERREGPQTTASSSSEAARLLALPRPTLLLRAPPPKEKELNRGRRERERSADVWLDVARRSSECAKLKRDGDRDREWLRLRDEIGEPPSSPSSSNVTTTTTVSLPKYTVLHFVTFSFVTVLVSKVGMSPLFSLHFDKLFYFCEGSFCETLWFSYHESEQAWKMTVVHHGIRISLPCSNSIHPFIVGRSALKCFFFHKRCAHSSFAIPICAWLR